MRAIEDDDKGGLFAKLRPFLILLAIATAGAVAFYFFGPKTDRKPKKSTVAMVNIMPPLPPPPPPPPPKPEPTPPPEEPSESEQRDDTPMMEEEQPSEEPPEEEPSEPEPEAMGTNNIGEGGPDYGLKAGGGGGIIGGTGTGGAGRRGGTKFGWYAGKVQSRVAEALRANKTTKTARFSLKARIWVNEFGVVTRATLEGSSGDPGVDAAIRDRILSGLQLPEPPPEDMPMPIVMRLSASRP